LKALKCPRSKGRKRGKEENPDQEHVSTFFAFCGRGEGKRRKGREPRAWSGYEGIRVMPREGEGGGKQ